MAICIIPARFGSKRLKKKNLKDFNGLPLIDRTILLAKESNLFSRIIVNSDSEEILERARVNKVEYYLRNIRLANDNTTTSETIKDQLLKQKIPFDELVVVLQCTSPLRSMQFLKEFLKASKKVAKDDALFSVSKLRKKIGNIKNKKFKNLNYNFGDRSQDLNKSKEIIFFENGLGYAIRCKGLLDYGIFGKNQIPFIWDRYNEIIDIDDEFDFKFAETLSKKNENK